ncbi:uncharacterized protein [Lolium perenne]|uniref:uncharacterized protein isoform X2 n=1 Tax=Lolium perenne TaxID=4522 RepID=UPI003A99DA14
MAFFLLTAAASPFPSCLQRRRRASWLLHTHPPLHHACKPAPWPISLALRLEGLLIIGFLRRGASQSRPCGGAHMEAAGRCGDLRAELRRLRTLSISCFSGSRSGSSTQGPSPLVLLLSPNNIPQSRVVPRFSPAAGCLGGRRTGGLASTGLEGGGFWHGPYNCQDGAPPELLFVLSPQIIQLQKHQKFMSIHGVGVLKFLMKRILEKAMVGFGLEGHV